MPKRNPRRTDKEWLDLIPVSYTHIDVYKRQDYRSTDKWTYYDKCIQLLAKSN